MDWITSDIAIGDYLEAQDTNVLAKNSIRSILGLTRALQGISEKDLAVEIISVIPLIDGAGNDPRWLREAIDILAELVRRAPPVLVLVKLAVAGRQRSWLVT